MGQLLQSKALCILFIYIGTCFYVTASYLHLALGKSWTFLSAFLIAVPLVIIEYQFSLRGNYAAHASHGMGALQILVLTLAFYFLNLWVLNVVVLKTRVVIWRELLCFALVAAAFVITTSI
jgi:hypothetical protein